MDPGWRENQNFAFLENATHINTVLEQYLTVFLEFISLTIEMFAHGVSKFRLIPLRKHILLVLDRYKKVS